MLDVRRLRILQELEAHGTVTAAAAALHLTPSAVSQQLAALAREAGAELIEREGRCVRLTGAGRVLVAHAHAVMAALEAARADIAEHAAGRVGLERASGFPSAIAALLAPAAAALQATTPGWRVEISEAETEDALPLLAQGHLDLAIVMSSSRLPCHDDPRIHLVPLLTDPFEAVLPTKHLLVGEPQLALADLAQQNWIASGPGTACREILINGCQHAGFQPRIIHSATDFSAARALVAAGLGVTLIPRLANTGVDGSAGQTTTRPLHGHVPVRHLYAALRRGTGTSPLLSAIHNTSAKRRSQRNSATASPHLDAGAH